MQSSSNSIGGSAVPVDSTIKEGVFVRICWRNSSTIILPCVEVTVRQARFHSGYREGRIHTSTPPSTKASTRLWGGNHSRTLAQTENPCAASSNAVRDHNSSEPPHDSADIVETNKM